MTKKRFIKLLMAKGKSRNEAQKIAMACKSYKIPYKKAFLSFQIDADFKNAIQKLTEAFEKSSTSISGFIHSLNKLSNVIQERGLTDATP